MTHPLPSRPGIAFVRRILHAIKCGNKKNSRGKWTLSISNVISWHSIVMEGKIDSLKFLISNQLTSSNWWQIYKYCTISMALQSLFAGLDVLRSHTTNCIFLYFHELSSKESHPLWSTFSRWSILCPLISDSRKHETDRSFFPFCIPSWIIAQTA